MTTLYVFIGRDLVAFSNDVHLERLISEIQLLNLNLAGAAVRTDKNRHWSHGC